MTRLGKRGLLRLPTALIAVVSLMAAFAPGGAQAQEGPVGCGYGTGGPYAPNLCWFDMSGYNDAKARSDEGQQMSITLPGGYVVKFTLTSRQVPGHVWRVVESRTAPIETRFAFGKGGYVGIPGKPVLYSQGPNGTNGVELKLSDISVVDSGGRPVTGYKFVVADAENNIKGEDFTWTSDKPLSLLGVLNEKSPAGCHNAMTGLGTTTVTCTGQGSEPGPPDPRYDAVVVGADTPSQIALSMTTFARSGVAFAIMTSKLQVTKQVVGRVRPSDSFDVKAISPEGSTLATASTGAGNTATTGELTVLPLSGGASYKLEEEATPASGTRQSDYARSWSCTNNGVAEPSLPSGSEPSVSISPQAGDFIACTVTNTQQAADLSVHKSVSAESAAVSKLLTYTMQVENGGPSGADSTVLKDTLPAGVRYVSNTSGCSVAALPVIECSLGTLLDGESRTVQIVGELEPTSAGTLQTNVARVSALQPDPEPANNESSAGTAVEPFADLAITKTVDQKAVGTIGEHITYTLVAENKGQNESIATMVTDTMPAGLTFVSDDAGCDTSALPTITCHIGALPKGAADTIKIVGEVNGTISGAVIRNTATVGGSLFDPDMTNNEASAPLEVEPLSDLAVTKVATVSAARPGDEVTYLIKAENKGPTPDLSTQITDILPAGLEYVSDDAGCDTTALPTITCKGGVLAKGQFRVVTLVAKVLGSGGTIENTAEVTGPNHDPDLANNFSAAKIAIEPVSDLRITKTATSASVKPGETLGYTLQVENEGPSDSPGATVTDSLPASLEYVSNDGGCTVSAGRDISCAVGPLASGETKTIHLLTAVTANASGTIENTATVSGVNFDPDPSNEAKASTTVEEYANLAITKTAPAAAKPGENITYTVVAENEGPSTSDPTVVNDLLPAGVSYVSNDAGCTVLAPEVVCDLGPLANGEAKTLHIVARVTATTGTVVNTAAIEGPLPDFDESDDEASASTAVEALSHLVFHKTAGAATVKAGEPLTYTLEVENQGPSASATNTMTDTLPAGLAYVSDNGGCDTSALPTITCDVGPLASGNSAKVEIVTEVEAGAIGTIQNAARVKGPNTDPEPTEEEATASTPIVPFAADLALTKSASSSAGAEVGDTITYTLTATDNGPDPSPETVVTDDLPAGLTYVSDDAGCRATALPKLECDLGTLANGEARSFHVVTRVASVDAGAIVNTATVAGADGDPTPSDNSASARTDVAAPPTTPPPSTTPSPAATAPSTPPPPSPTEPPPGAPPAHHKPGHPKPQPDRGKPHLVLRKTASASVARPSAVVGYRITVWNKGDGDARQVKVCDEPPAGLKILRSEPATSPGAGTCWTQKVMAAGTKRIFRVTAQIATTLRDAVERNRATVSAANVKGVRTASAGVHVKPLPNRACGSSLSRPVFGGPRIAFRC
jgi:uncharacterized repeat protein (TIGR01451 family)